MRAQANADLRRAQPYYFHTFVAACLTGDERDLPPGHVEHIGE